MEGFDDDVIVGCMLVDTELDNDGIEVSMAVFDEYSLPLKDGEPLIEMELEAEELSNPLCDIDAELLADIDFVMVGVSV
jgi:hypothetical protein